MYLALFLYHLNNSTHFLSKPKYSIIVRKGTESETYLKLKVLIKLKPAVERLLEQL